MLCFRRNGSQQKNANTHQHSPPLIAFAHWPNLLRGILKHGWEHPTRVQRQVIVPFTRGRHLFVQGKGMECSGIGAVTGQHPLLPGDSLLSYRTGDCRGRSEHCIDRGLLSSSGVGCVSLTLVENTSLLQEQQPVAAGGGGEPLYSTRGNSLESVPELDTVHDAWILPA